MDTGQTRRWRAQVLARWGILILGLLPALTACYPYESNNSASDYDIAITQFDRQANFYPVQPSTQPTYFMPKKVDIVPPNQANPITIDPTLETAILAQVAANMAALKYTRIDPTIDITPPYTPPPNFIVTVSATTSTYYGYTYWGGWWGYGCYCYGGYYPYMQPYSFTTGTILINMADASKVPPPPPGATLTPMIWGCAINGLINSGNATARVTDQINQCFAQSPYLGPS